MRNGIKLRFRDEEGGEYPQWQEVRLGEAFVFLSHNGFARKYLDYSGEVMNLHYGDILTRYPSVLDIDSWQEFIPRIQDQYRHKIKTAFLQDGDVAMADAAEDYAVGQCTEICNVKHKVVAGMDIHALRPVLPFAPGFLGYYLNSSSFHDQLLPYVTFSKVYSIIKSNLSKVTVVYPSVSEQRQIAALFTALDRHLEAARDQLEVLKRLKQGLLERVLG